MVETSISVAAKIAEYLVAPVARPFRYLWNYKTNLENLKNEVKKLEAKRDTVERLIKVGEEPLPDVKLWQENVKKIIHEASELINGDNPEQGNTQCCKGFSSPNLLKHYQRSKKAAGKLKDVDGLQREGEGFREFSRPTITKQPWLQSTEDYDAFESRTSILKKIMDALHNPDVNKVGIYGMGGIGKTTLAKEVGREAERDKLFNKIVFVEVSQSPNIKNIQGVIADNLKLKLTAETLSGRASELYEELKEKKKKEKILLILDNIWGTVDFKEVGIPLEEDRKELKLLLTMRSCDVLTNHTVESQHQFPINVLNGEDAWSLFKSKAGESIEKPYLKSIATEVVEVCGGIPLAIVVIAEALKNKGREDWKNALRELKQPLSESFEGDLAKVYKSIELSYKFLGKKELQQIFLLCSRMGRTHNASIQNLFIYGFGLGYFENINTMEEALCNVYALVNKLKATSLLLGAPNSQEFSVHDVVCHTARIIASRENVFTVIDDVIPRFLTNENTLIKCTSLTLHNYGELPKDLSFVCPKLKFLYMKAKESSSRILDNFFAHMSSLQVLHLVEMDFREPPTSFCFLVNLHALCLNQCKLGDTTVIGNLKKLEILCFRGSNIKKLPEEICHLTRLRLLDLTGCSKLSVIPPNVMSNLTKLEALCMGATSIQWEVERPSIERSNASIDELKHLCNLTLLEIHIPDPKMSKGLLSPKLERYKIIIGDKWKYWEYHSLTYRMLKLSLDTNEDGIISQLKGIEELELGEVPGATNLLDALDRNGFPTLKHLKVKSSSHCSGIVESCDALHSLQSLILKYLDNTEKICNSPLGANTFPQLRTIRVDNCPKLNNIFSFSTVTVLLRLEEIKVSDCENMKEIFAIEGQDDSNNIEVVNEIKFSQLRIMDLWNLPRLKSFCCKVKPASAMQLTKDTQPREIISRDEIDVLTSLFNDKVGFPNLEEIFISYMDNLKMIWHNQIAEDSFYKLKTLDVHKCKKLLIVLPSNMFGRFSRVESINVISCGSVEEIFDLEGINFEERHSIEPTQLKTLSIIDLPNLKNILSKDPGRILSFGNLQKLQVSGCPSLKNLFPASVARGLSELEYLSVSDCGVEEIVAKEGEVVEEPARFLFPKLISLKLRNLPELRTFYPGRHTIEGPVLKNLELYHCGKVRIFISEVLSIQELDIQTEQPFFLTEKAFPCLEELNLVGKNITMMWQVQIPERTLHNLKILEIGNDESTVLPLGIIRCFHNLETFSLFYGSYKEIFSYEEVQTQAQTPTKIKKLVLGYLKDLKYIWKQDSKLDFILQSLEVLQVWYCNGLINLMSSSASFQNLTVLEVQNCRSLTNMITSSTAKSLVQLIQMSIMNCKKITEIVENQGGVIEDRIIFSKLKSLSLQFLPNLTSFCSGNSTLEFPSLEELTMRGCPKMKNFSQGVSSTPILRKVEINWNSIELYSDGDINKAVQELYEKTTAHNSSKGHSSSSSHNLQRTRPQVLHSRDLRRTRSQVL